MNGPQLDGQVSVEQHNKNISSVKEISLALLWWDTLFKSILSFTFLQTSDFQYKSSHQRFISKQLCTIDFYLFIYLFILTYIISASISISKAKNIYLVIYFPIYFQPVVLVRLC